MAKHRLDDQTDQTLEIPTPPTDEDPPKGRHRAPHEPRSFTKPLAAVGVATVVTASVSGGIMASAIHSVEPQPVAEPTTASQRVIETPNLGRFDSRVTPAKPTPSKVALPKPPPVTQAKVSVKPKPPPPPKKPSWVDPVPGHDFNSGFGMRFGVMHQGVDLGAPLGTDVHAAASGTVEMATTYDYGGYGHTVIIDHGGGIKTLYAHNGPIYVSVGDKVAAGKVVAEVGLTGDTSGPHLHFEVHRDDVAINPVPFLASRGVEL